MYIIEGIAYPDKKTDLLKITEVKVLPGYTLWLKFSTGEEKVFDFSSLLDAPAFLPLKDKSLFDSVRLERGFPIWNDGDIDISPEYLYKNGKTA